MPPYGTPDFPAFTPSASAKLSGKTGLGENEQHFLQLWLLVSKKLQSSGPVVAGVIKRDGGSRRFFKNLLDRMVTDGKPDNAHGMKVSKFLKGYGLSYTQLLDLILQDGEYILPIPVNRQGDANEYNKCPAAWKEFIGI